MKQQTVPGTRRRWRNKKEALIHLFYFVLLCFSLILYRAELTLMMLRLDNYIHIFFTFFHPKLIAA